MLLVLALHVLEGDEESFGLFDGEPVRPRPRYECALFRNVSGTLPDVPRDHLKFGFAFAHGGIVAESLHRDADFQNAFAGLGFVRRYIAGMIRAGLATLAVALTSAPALGQSINEVRAANAWRDAARAEERQADELRRLRQIESDRALREDRARRNAARDARSSRRFD